jgi:hypothetical protein
MSEIIQQKVDCNLVRVEKVVYERKTLLGIFSWYVKVSTEKLHDDIFVYCGRDIENIHIDCVKIKNIYVNGIKCYNHDLDED